MKQGFLLTLLPHLHHKQAAAGAAEKKKMGKASVKRQSTAAAAASDDAPSTSEIHVLAVDDSIIDRKVIEKLLKTSSYRVTTVDSALRALEILGIVKQKQEEDDEEEEESVAVSNLNISMIITDYCMPHMTGYDLLKRVKESSTLREIPVVIMSSENVQTRIASCYELGAEDFIIKPVRMSDVKRLSGHLMRKRVVASTPVKPEITSPSPTSSTTTTPVTTPSTPSSISFKRKTSSMDHEKELSCSRKRFTLPPPSSS